MEDECKKRAAELRHELLFKQPESSHLGDCTICCLPLPLDESKSGVYVCCSKLICKGCHYANEIAGLAPSCPFCREPLPKTAEQCDKRNMKRIEMNDPVAICHEGGKQHRKGELGRAVEYWSKAAEFRDAKAHYNLSIHHAGREFEGKEILYHLEEAAIGGHPEARHCLGLLENKHGRVERAVKHWIIAATQGQDESIKALTDAFKDGVVEKEVLDAALRSHYAADDATKSPQREVADTYGKKESGATKS